MEPPPPPRRPSAPPTPGSLPSRGPEVVRSRRVRRARPLQPLVAVGWIAIAALGVSACVGVADIVSVFQSLRLVDELRGSEAAAADVLTKAAALEERAHAINIASIAALVVTAVAFLVWFARAHGNLVRRGLPKLQFSPGWAVGGFFVPLLNLVRPYEVMVEVWKGSLTIGLGEDRDRWRSARTTPWILGWWLLYVLGGLVVFVGTRMADAREPTIESLQRGSVVAVAGSFMKLAAAGCAAYLVATISRLQARAPEDDGAALGEVFS